MMNNIEFAYEWVLWFLILIPLLWVWHFFRHQNRKVKVVVPTQPLVKAKTPWIKLSLMHLIFGLKTIALGLLIIAIARPQSSSSWQDEKTEGIDIILAIDVSSSMLAQDLKPNRLEAAKKVATDFVEQRINDRIGLVVYAGESYTQSPLTTDHSVIKNLMSDIDFGTIDDGTAIGMGLATSVNRLKESEAKSKVVILLTDGTNNAGDIPPLTAAEIAHKFGVKVYAIAVGTNGIAPMPVQLPNGQIGFSSQKVNIDETTLKKIAEETQGQFFRATDNNSLKEIYATIDQLEKTEIDVKEFRKRDERFYSLAMLAAIILLGQFFVQKLFIKSLAL